MASFETWEDTIVGAHHRAKVIGVAYAVRWPVGRFSVEYRKPLLRNQNFRLLECFDDGREQLA